MHGYLSLMYMSWKRFTYIPNYVFKILTAASVHSKNCRSLSVCVSYRFNCVFCMSMHEVLSVHAGQALVARRKWDCAMEFVALGIWFIFQSGFLSYLQDFPRFWLQLGWEAGKRGRGPKGLGGGGCWRREGGDRAGVCHTQLSTAGEMERKAMRPRQQMMEVRAQNIQICCYKLKALACSVKTLVSNFNSIRWNNCVLP